MHHGQVAFRDLYRPPNVCFSIWPKCQVLLKLLYGKKSLCKSMQPILVGRLPWSLHYDDNEDLKIRGIHMCFSTSHFSVSLFVCHGLLFTKLPRYLFLCSIPVKQRPLSTSWLCNDLFAAMKEDEEKLKWKKNRDCLNRDATFHDSFRSLINAAIHIIGTKLS